MQMCFAQIYCILIIAQDQILTGNIGLFQTTSTAARSYPGFPDENYPFRILHWILSATTAALVSREDKQAHFERFMKLFSFIF